MLLNRRFLDMKKVNVGVIGLGCRGPSLIKDAILPNDRTKIVAVCDCYEDRVNNQLKFLKEQGNDGTKGYTDYRELLADKNVEAVIISTSWDMHVPIAIAAMKAGKAVGLEVGGAYSVQSCHDLVRTWEETRVPFMFLENCMYDWNETALFNMIDEGLFGTIVAIDGGYMHDLREEVSYGVENRHYRLQNYIKRNCDNYPTHELGPIAHMLGINRGNRMVSLVSVASKACGLHEYILANKPDDTELVNTKFAQGDIVTTIITCAGGETITLRLDTTLPRAYGRGLTIHGTKGMFSENDRVIFLDDVNKSDEYRPTSLWGNFLEFSKKYLNDNWAAVEKGLKVQGHGGMDYFMMKDFIDCVAEGKEPPFDVYDAASWIVISPLTEQSISLGGTPVSIPDFTCGRWVTRR